MDMITFSVPPESAGRKLGSILKSNLGISRRIINNLKYSGRITVNEIPAHTDLVLGAGDSIKLDLYDDESNVTPEKVDFGIIHEDDAVLIADKPGDLVVHPTCSHPCGTLANGVSFHFQSKGLNIIIRPVNRLDRGTSGIVVFAKDQYTHFFLSKQLLAGTFRKEYLGIVAGTFEPPCGRIILPIARKPGSIMEREVSDKGDKAVTWYEAQKVFNGCSLVKFLLETGRTHQIRVHCLAAGHPLLGDSLYGGAGLGLIGRQALHAHRVGFVNPLDGKYHEYTAPLPEDIERLMR